MLRIVQVHSLDLPELAPYRSMRWQHEHREQGIFVAEGEKVVRRLLLSDLEVLSVLLPEKWIDEYSTLLEARTEPIHVFTAQKSLLESMTGFSMYQGVLAVAKVPKPWSLEEALSNSSTPLLFVAADALSSAENMGGLIRNCVAFGVNTLINGETSCSPYLRRAVRSSMGTIFKMPVVESKDLAESLRQLRSRGIRTIAAHPHATEKELFKADFRSDCCIVLGSEGLGISQAVLAECDDVVVLPMKNEVDSLNVGTAGAVFLYEAQRQRGTIEHR
jgi:tRNA G18 (ribose-2'-O)-methylase SpoU